MRYLSHHSVLWAIPLVLQFTLSYEGSCQNESLRRLQAIYSEGISGLGALKSFQTVAFWLVCYLPANSSLVFPKRQSQLISSETSLGKAKLPCPYPGRRGPLLSATQLPALPGDFPSVLADPQRSLGTPEPGEPRSTGTEQPPLHELLELGYITEPCTGWAGCL